MRDNFEDVKVGDEFVVQPSRYVNEYRRLKVTRVTKTSFFSGAGYCYRFRKKDGLWHGTGGDIWNRTHAQKITPEIQKKLEEQEVEEKLRNLRHTNQKALNYAPMEIQEEVYKLLSDYVKKEGKL